MRTVKIYCDICGAEIPEPRPESKYLTTVSTPGKKYNDICDKCLKKLNKVLKNETTT